METTQSIDKYSRRILSTDEVLKVLLNGGNLTGVVVDDESELEKFNQHAEEVLKKSISLSGVELNMSVDEFHNKNINSWFVPERYFKIDTKQYLIDKCQSDIEINRVITEYNMFEERELIPLLSVFIYLVDIMREHGVVCGVGRGSSVASYCLYLIGIHRIDSIKYDLDINEFLK